MKSILGISSLGLGVKEGVVGIIEDGLCVLKIVPGNIMGILGGNMSSNCSIEVSLSLL